MCNSVLTLTRTFYAVGQGAFYAEKFTPPHSEPIVVLYDCGGRNVRAFKNHMPLSNGGSIKFLFISHFHRDHICGIQHLLHSYRVENVILPLVSMETKVLHWIWNKRINGKITCEKFLFSPTETIFGFEAFNSPNIFYVLPQKLVGDYGKFVSGMERNYEDLPSSGNVKYLKNDALLQINYNGIDWLYIPFNHEMEARHSEFLQILQDNQVPIDNLSDFLSQDNRAELWRDYKEELISAYKQISFNNLNMDSMAVYSGIGSPNNFQYETSLVMNGLPSITGSLPTGALYTGDIKITGAEFFKRYDDFESQISILQIPHHGSKHNFDERLYRYGSKKIVCCNENTRLERLAEVLQRDWLHYPEMSLDQSCLFVTENENLTQEIRISYP